MSFTSKEEAGAWRRMDAALRHAPSLLGDVMDDAAPVPQEYELYF
jgi:hypothetical protein